MLGMIGPFLLSFSSNLSLSGLLRIYYLRISYSGKLPQVIRLVFTRKSRTLRGGGTPRYCSVREMENAAAFMAVRYQSSGTILSLKTKLYILPAFWIRTVLSTRPGPQSGGGVKTLVGRSVCITCEVMGAKGS